MRCVIRILRNKVLPVVLSCCLVLGILVSGASAYSYPDGLTTIDQVFGSMLGNWNTSSAINRKNSNLEALASCLISNESSCYLSTIVVSNKTYLTWISVSSGILYFRNNYLYVSDKEAQIKYCQISDLSQTGNLNLKTVTQSASYVIDDISFYLVESGVSLIGDFFESRATVYCSLPCYLGEAQTLVSPRNLDLGTYSPDTRIFEVWKSVDYPESTNPLEYINVKLDGSVDLNKISSQKIRIDYIDQDGNNKYKVFSESDFHDIQYFDELDYYTFYLFPYLISSYEFSIIGATYYSDLVEWGEKTIELDLTFNEGTIYPLPQDWNSVYTVNQYFQSRSNGTVNGGVTKLALSDSGYFWVDYYQKVCQQAFDVKVLFIPYFMNSDLLSINLETLFQLYEQYDVIFTGVSPSQFNLLIPTLDYNDLFTYYSQNGFYPALKKLQEAYVFYSNLGLNHDYSDYSWSLSNDEVGFIVTRSFLLKRTLTALGDIDDRLLEFETNLVGEDSLGASLQTKLDNLLSLEHDFFSDVSRFFQKLEYNLNGLSLGNIEKYLEDIWSATVGERNFNYTDLLPEPLKSIFLYFRGWFISSTQYMQDFIEVSNSSLYGDDLMKLPFEASVVPVLPFEPGTPTPIPIPTLEAGLIEVGGD